MEKKIDTTATKTDAHKYSVDLFVFQRRYRAYERIYKLPTLLGNEIMKKSSSIKIYNDCFQNSPCCNHPYFIVHLEKI